MGKTMKNKSKLEKIKNQKKKTVNVPAEWLYLSPSEVSVRDLSDSFENPEQIEIWEDARVAEVILGEKASMDMEWYECDLGDEESNAFLEKHQIRTMYVVTIPPQEFEAARICMQKITARNGGFFCGDTDDFTPMVK